MRRGRSLQRRRWCTQDLGGRNRQTRRDFESNNKLCPPKVRSGRKASRASIKCPEIPGIHFPPFTAGAFKQLRVYRRPHTRPSPSISDGRSSCLRTTFSVVPKLLFLKERKERRGRWRRATVPSLEARGEEVRVRHSPSKVDPDWPSLERRLV